MKPFTFNTTRSIVCEPGASGRLAALAGALLGPRVVLVTDKGVRALGITEAALASLSAAGIAVDVFDGVAPHPPERNVLHLAALIRAHGATGIVAIGGGSSMDVAKVASLTAAGGQALADLYGTDRANGPRLPLVLVPTTAGTGSEVTPVAIITTGESEKKTIVSPLLLPDLAILDADLTLGLPPVVTAASGIDAMVHAVEAFSSASPNNNPVSNGLARQALRLLAGNISEATFNGRDRPARSAMLLGALLAGQAFANAPAAAVHALAAPVGGRFAVPHGIANAVMLAPVLRFNLPAAAPLYADIAADAFPHLAHVASRKRAEAFIEALADLVNTLKLPSKLRDLGLPRDALPTIAAEALQQTRLLDGNPREMTEADALAIYEAAY